MEDSIQQHEAIGNGNGTEDHQRTDQEEEEEQEEQMGMSSIYPPVPNLYKRFTKQNLKRLGIIESHESNPDDPEWHQLTPDQRIQKQNEILSQHAKDNDIQDQDGDGDDIHQPVDFDLLSEMKAPNPDWIVEDGYYALFGDRWPLPDVFPTLEENGIAQLYPKDQPLDRRKVLLTLLKTFLTTHLELVTVLLSPPDFYTQTQFVPLPGPPVLQEDGVTWAPMLERIEVERTEAMDKWEHIRTVVINFQYLINQCRPMQVSRKCWK